MDRFESGIFNGELAQKGYALNKMCYSFNDASNRAAFLADEDAYCTKYGLNEEQRAAVRSRNRRTFVEAGCSLYYFIKFSRMFDATAKKK